MNPVEPLYQAAARAGLLTECHWHPIAGGPKQTTFVGFAAPDNTLLDGLTTSTDYVISYPSSVFVGLTSRESIEINNTLYIVREVHGDETEKHATLFRV